MILVTAGCTGAMKLERYPGAVYVVVDENGVTHQWVGGTATSESMFMLNSTTKMFTALALMQFDGAGTLSLEDPAGKHVENFPYSDAVTLHHLAAHTAGVANPLPTRWFHLSQEHDGHDETAALARVLSENPQLKHEPGQQYLYSNLGYWILGAVIMNASGQDLEQTLDEHVRSPLDIPADSLTYLPPQSDALLAGRHPRTFFGWVLRSMTDKNIWDAREGKWRRLHPIAHDGRAYGGLYASADGVIPVLQDLVKQDPVLLSSQQRDELFTLGLAHGELDGVAWVGKPGGGPGFFSNVRIYPENGIATLLLVNLTEVREGRIQKLSDHLDKAFTNPARQ